MKTLNIGMIGTRFMGRAHSNAFLQAPRFFELPFQPVLKVACGRDPARLEQFARNWGWQETETDWRKLVERPDIDVIDIGVPPNLHKEIVIAAAQNGKHIFCEKPAALNAGEAREMFEAAEQAGVLHYLNHNYRRLPAVTYARQMIDEGRLGDIFHWRGTYMVGKLNDPNATMNWHMRKEIAGGGPMFDLAVHNIDLSRYLVGDVAAVSAIAKTFVRQRPLQENPAQIGEVNVEDAGFMLLEYVNGALGSIDTTWYAGGRRNFNTFEIYGSKGTLLFNLEHLNHLQYCDLSDPPERQGFRDIMITARSHPYLHAWWPPGHPLGYEHSFIHAVRDFVWALERGEGIRPNLEDGVREMEILDAAVESARTGQKIHIGGLG